MTTAQLIQKLAGTKQGEDFDGVFAAKVLSVDTAEYTCDVEPLDGKADVFGVRLNAQTGQNKGWLCIPAVGSVVVVVMLNKVSGFVAMTSELTEVLHDGGLFGGLVKVGELTQKLNAIEQDINTLKQAFSSWVPVPNDGGAALKAAAGSWFGQQLTETQKADIENEAVKH